MYSVPYLMVDIRFIYCGIAEITLEIAQDLLPTTDQYLVDRLKCLCEDTIAQDLSKDNAASLYELSEAFNATTLRHKCMLFILDNFDDMRWRPGFTELIQRIILEI